MNTESLLEYLSHETEKLSERTKASQGDSDKMFLCSLESDRVSLLMRKLREMVIDLEQQNGNSSATKKYRKKMSVLSSRMQDIQHAVQVSKDRDVDNWEKQRSESIKAPESEPKPPKPETKPDFNASGELEEKLTLENDAQESISMDILAMARTIKQNAIEFADKLSRDNELLSSTSEALNRSTGNMSKVGGKLNQYRSTSAIGWRFYLFAVLFMIVALVVSMVLIQIFPKW